MDYEKLKSEIPPEIMSLCEEIKTVKQQLDNTRQRRDEMQKDVLELQADIAKRKEKSWSAFMGTKEKTDNFLGRLRNDRMELELKESSVKDLVTSFIPKLESDLAAHEKNLKILTDIFYTNRLRLVNDEIDLKGIEILKMGDAFMQDFQRLYSDLGLTLIFNREELLPIRWWTAQEQQEQKIRVGLAGSKEPSYQQVWANYHKTVEDSEPAKPLLDKPSVPVEAAPEPPPLPSFEQLQQRQAEAAQEDVEAGPFEPPVPALPIENIFGEPELDDRGPV